MANVVDNDKTMGLLLKRLDYFLTLIGNVQEYLNARQSEEKELLKKKLLNDVTEKEAIFKIFEFLLLPKNNTLKQNGNSEKYSECMKNFDAYKILFYEAIEFDYSKGKATYFAKLAGILQEIRALTSVQDARSQIRWNDPSQHQKAVAREEITDLDKKYNDYLTLFHLANQTNYIEGMEICFKTLIEIVQERGTTISVKDARSQDSWNDPSQHQKAVNMEKTWELSGIFDELENLFKIANDNNYQQGIKMCFNTMINIFNELHQNNTIDITAYLKRIAIVIEKLNDKDLINLLYTWALGKYGKEYVATLFDDQKQAGIRNAP